MQNQGDASVFVKRKEKQSRKTRKINTEMLPNGMLLEKDAFHKMSLMNVQHFES